MKERQSNFELLRIILMIAIPLYHLMLYSGMNIRNFNEITIPSLLMTSGSAIVADYAFMAMSSYFFLNSSRKNNLSKIFKLVVQIIFIYLIKTFILREVLNLSQDFDLFQGYFYKGSWWFIYVYIIILCIYPFLNYFIEKLNTIQLKVICAILGMWFLINGITYINNIVHDLVAFLFTYFVMAYLKRINYKNFLWVRNSRKNMLMIYTIGFIVTFFSCLFVNLIMIEKNGLLAIEIIRRLIGKYAIHQFVMGIAIFLIFKEISISYNEHINNFAQNVFYVFLLHETVMACFWSKGKLVIVDDVMPYDSVFSLIIWCGIYLLCSFAFAIIVRWIYEHTIKLLLDKIILINRGE